MSLPRAFRTTPANIPAAVPYLTVPPDSLRKWRERLGAASGAPAHRHRLVRHKGGLWNRDIPLATLLPLLERTDCEWHVAQTTIEQDDRRLLERRPERDGSQRDLEDFADTAALVALMDLVVSVDTVLAHLAGALARPVWTLLPFGAEYRWMMGRSDSPWYPTMRLFRQPRLKDWSAVVAAVGLALDASEA